MVITFLTKQDGINVSHSHSHSHSQLTILKLCTKFVVICVRFLLGLVTFLVVTVAVHTFNGLLGLVTNDVDVQSQIPFFDVGYVLLDHHLDLFGIGIMLLHFLVWGMFTVVFRLGI